MGQAKLKTLSKPSNPDLIRSIMEAVSNFDVTTSPEWHRLDELSNHTEVEALEANPDGVFVETAESPDSFRATANVYVTLNYGGKRDHSSMSDSYPVEVQGRIDRTSQKVSVEELKIDTSSFYK